MKISYNWLKSYIDLNVTPERLAELLTMAGLTVEAIHKLADDKILEVEVTSNRPDWLSVIGVAREISAITGKKLNRPSLSRLPKSKEHAGKIVPQIYG
jgi:phenylalanyl-tRNA synthetase beta chain